MLFYRPQSLLKLLDVFLLLALKLRLRVALHKANNFVSFSAV